MLRPIIFRMERNIEEQYAKAECAHHDYTSLDARKRKAALEMKNIR